MSTAQDYTTYTEVDTPARITVAATQITVADLDDNEEVYVTKDFVASLFAGDFEHTLNFMCTAQVGAETVFLWGVCNTDDELGVSITNGIDLLALYWSNGTLVLLEQNGIVGTSDTSAALSLNTRYHIRVVRDESLGDYGKLFCYIYTDKYYMNLVDKLTVTLTENKNFQYLFGMSGKGDGGGAVSWTGDIKNLALDQYPYTLANLRLRVRDLLSEATPDFFADAQINRWINDAEREIAALAECIKHIDTISTTSGQRTVAFSGQRVEFLEYNNLALLRILQTQLGRRPDKATVPERWFPNGSTIGIDPLPDDTYSLAAYIADYPSEEMIDNPDIPQVSPEFRPLIILNALGKANVKDQRAGAALQMLSMFENELAFHRLDDVESVPDGTEVTQYPDSNIQRQQ